MNLEKHYHIVDVCEITGFTEWLVKNLTEVGLLNGKDPDGEGDLWISVSSLSQLATWEAYKPSNIDQIRCTRML